MVVSLPEMGTREEEQVWGMLAVRALGGGQGELSWVTCQPGRCVPEAGHLEGRGSMYTEDVGRGLRLSGEERGTQLSLVLPRNTKEAVGRCIHQRGEEVSLEGLGMKGAPWN